MNLSLTRPLTKEDLHSFIYYNLIIFLIDVGKYYQKSTMMMLWWQQRGFFMANHCDWFGCQICGTNMAKVAKWQHDTHAKRRSSSGAYAKMKE